MLARDKFMVEMNLRLAEMYLRQMHSTQLTYSACGPFTTNKERMQTSEEIGNSSICMKN